MYNYTIEPDAINERVMVIYTRDDGKVFHLVKKTSTTDEAEMHLIALENAQVAERWFAELDSRPENPTLSETTGQTKTVVETDKPAYDSITQYLVKSWDNSESAVTEVWTVTDFSNDEKEARIRGHRNYLLAETDLYALSDMTLTESMTTYRQALRDVPQQSDFPATVTWPTKPE